VLGTLAATKGLSLLEDLLLNNFSGSVPLIQLAQV
jgi:hypothetical protein